VGPPIMPPSNEGRAPRSAVKDFSANLHGELQRLFDEAQARAGMRSQ